eukprot:CAMPEP_0202339136 /NCGR_PEP_ID=MMETSP1126-20121109/1133_1 /ASSEMBLY_ACC=CAM_ASM_000457 /TAXON_ID=3047 /ORGANISM="Dunaliella tertiolecta, Strain CCMP1320" /LENGTH=64 /DNA_ID=CAMNT_0048929655 /DNA_START=542 /DNA_END=736 /DNA_ORIENTATION=-
MTVIDGDVSQWAQSQAWNRLHSGHEGSQFRRYLGFIKIIPIPPRSHALHLRLWTACDAQHVDRR